MGWNGDVMSRMNGQVEVDRQRMVWELIGRQNVEHSAEMLWSTGIVRVGS